MTFCRGYDMNRLGIAAFVGWALLTVGCGLEAAPPTDAGGSCENPGETCLVLRVTMLDSVRRDAPGDLRGDLHWGLYNDGDVSVTGPGSHASVAGDFVADADLSAPGSEVDVPIPNLQPKAYQVLAYLDDDGNGDSSEGDPVTLPSQGFDVPAGQTTTVDVVLDFIR